MHRGDDQTVTAELSPAALLVGDNVALARQVL
jgi:hypothetical protein